MQKLIEETIGQTVTYTCESLKLGEFGSWYESSVQLWVQVNVSENILLEEMLHEWKNIR